MQRLFERHEALSLWIRQSTRANKSGQYMNFSRSGNYSLYHDLVPLFIVLVRAIENWLLIFFESRLRATNTVFCMIFNGTECHWLVIEIKSASKDSVSFQAMPLWCRIIWIFGYVLVWSHTPLYQWKPFKFSTQSFLRGCVVTLILKIYLRPC